MVLRVRFGEASEALSKQLQGLTASQLDELVAKAMTIESLVVFEALIHNLKAQPENDSARNGQNL